MTQFKYWIFLLAAAGSLSLVAAARNQEETKMVTKIERRTCRALGWGQKYYF